MLYVGSQLASSLLSMSSADRTQRMIFLALPFVFVTFVIRFPAGLLVYWITTNLWTIVQQLIIKKRLGPLRPKLAEGESPPSLFGGLSGLGGGGGARRREGLRQRAQDDARAQEGARGRDRGQRAEGPAEHAPAGATQQEEEETVGETSMSDSADRVRDLLEHVSDALALDATVEIVEEGREIHATLEGEDLGLFIGRHGQTIDAVQHLAFKTATRDQPPSAGVRVVVDAAGYRERREQALQRQADEAAADAVRSKRPVALDAMSATERKVVHEYLKDRDDVETYSEGTEPDRHLVVAPLD